MTSTKVIVYLKCDICKVPCIWTDMCYRCRTWMEMYPITVANLYQKVPLKDGDLEALLMASLELFYGPHQNH